MIMIMIIIIITITIIIISIIIIIIIIMHLITDTRPAALSIICHGKVELNIASLKSLVFAVSSFMFVTVYERTWHKRKWQRWRMMKYETLTTVESACVQFPQKGPLWEGPSNCMSQGSVGWPKNMAFKGWGVTQFNTIKSVDRNYTVITMPYHSH